MKNEIQYTDTKYLENRGSLYTVYDKRSTPIDFVQDKISKSFQGVIRGFHGDDKTSKLITCLYGKIKLITYDIDTDIKNTYILSGDDKVSKSILVKPRVLNAHQCLSNTCIFYYKWSDYYTTPEDQWSVRYNDQSILPGWDTDLHCIVSERDKNSKSLTELKEHVGS